MWLEFKVVKKTFVVQGKECPVLGTFSGGVKRRNILVIIGASGSGKSTLLRILAGLDVDYIGRIEVNGKPIIGPSRRVGLVFQDTRLLPWMSVYENVEFALARDLNTAQRRTRVLAALETVGLERRGSAYPRELSGGMAKRVALARSIVTTPELLLLDEPFAGLDLTAKLRLIRIIDRVRDQIDLTLIVVTHDPDEALMLGDEIAALSGSPAILGPHTKVELPKPRDLRTALYKSARDGLISFMLGAPPAEGNPNVVPAK
jgi:sulfonate transport system ATP-binding protein